VPIIGCGGIRSWRDAVEFILVGATAVQVGTAISFEGPEVFQSIKKGIEAYLNKEKHWSVREIVGLAHRC